MRTIFILLLYFVPFVSFAQIFKYKSNNTTDTLYSNFVGIRSYNYENSNYCNKNVRNDKVKKTIKQTWFYDNIKLAEAIYLDEKIHSIVYFNNEESNLPSLYFEFDENGLIDKEVYTFNPNDMQTKKSQTIEFAVSNKGLRIDYILLEDE